MGKSARTLAPAVFFCVFAACGGSTPSPASPSPTPAPAPLPPAPAPLSGRVTTDTSARLAGARVSIRPSTGGYFPSVYTNDTGEYRFESLAPGDTLISAEALRFQSVDRRVVVDGVNRLDFVLSPLPQVVM